MNKSNYLIELKCKLDEKIKIWQNSYDDSVLLIAIAYFLFKRLCWTEELISNLSSISKEKKKLKTENELLRLKFSLALGINSLLRMPIIQGQDQSVYSELFMFFLGTLEAGQRLPIISSMKKHESFSLFGDMAYESIQDLMHLEVLSKHANKQWSDQKADYQKAEKEAVDYYSKDGSEWHYILAKRLAKKYNLSETQLRKRIVPIAKEKGKAFGFPSMKK